MHRALLAASFVAVLGSAASAQDTQSFDRIEHGRYLAVLSDCAACHTAPGGQPFAGGLAIDTPFGKLVAPNITPDRDTGIGAMTNAEFLAALHDGRGHNGTRLYPAMPYPAYSKLSDEDVLAIRAYLGTVDPVSNAVVSNQLPFPFNIRLTMVVWNWLNFTPGRFKPDPQKSAEWNRGAYIVEGAAHCGTCHTPKNLLGGDKASQPLMGEVLQGWYAPNITINSHNGIGGWSKEDLVQYLKTGANSWTLASGPMAEAVSHSTSLMTDEDIAAIAVYLKDSGANSTGPSRPRHRPTTTSCAPAPPSTKMRALHVTGIAGPGRQTCFHNLPEAPLSNRTIRPRSYMWCCKARERFIPRRRPPLRRCLPSIGASTIAQVAAVLTYIRNSWGNAAPVVNASAVADMRVRLEK